MNRSIIHCQQEVHISIVASKKYRHQHRYQIREGRVKQIVPSKENKIDSIVISGREGSRRRDRQHRYQEGQVKQISRSLHIFTHGNVVPKLSHVILVEASSTSVLFQ